jgi:isochorismate hydrolase
MCKKVFFTAKDDMALVVVDIQDNLLKVFKDEIREKVVNKSSLLIRYFRYKKLPILVFEQYPKGIGPTNQAIKDALGDDYNPIVKNCFSGVCADGFKEAFEKVNKKQIVLIGIEGHICVLQTCCVLISMGIDVFVPADAVGSRLKLDWQIGVKNMEGMGAAITTAEILTFKWMEKAGTEDFKAMLPYLK